jgi:hypothetical protein
VPAAVDSGSVNISCGVAMSLKSTMETVLDGHWLASGSTMLFTPVPL